MRRLALLAVAMLALALTLAVPRPPSALAADDAGLLRDLNPSFEVEESSTVDPADPLSGQPVDWTPTSWPHEGASWTPDFGYVKDGGHTGTHSVKVTITGYVKPGDAKWVVDHYPAVGVQVTGGSYYTFSDWYKSNTSTAVSAWYQLDGETGDTGHWANLFAGVPPADEWTQYTTGFTMPAGAVRAYFVHFIARNGYLQTDDYSMRETDAPAGFAHPMVSLTFDNGSQGILDRGIPELDTRDLPSTQYVPTEEVRNGASWMMSQADLAALDADGHEIASHSDTHPSLTDPGVHFAKELGGSREFLENALGGKSVTGFAYPFGDYDATVIAALRDAGYTHGRSVEPGYNDARLEPFDIQVQNVTPGTTVADFEGWVDHAKANNYWLVVVYHEVLPDDSTIPDCEVDPTVDPCRDAYDTTLSVFRGQLDYLVDQGLQANVLTVRDALATGGNRFPNGSVAIAPQDPDTDGTLTATPAFTDPDRDALHYAYQWFRGDAAISGATGATLDLARPGHGGAGDRIRVVVTADDGHGGSVTAEAQVTVRATGTGQVPPPTPGGTPAPAPAPAPVPAPANTTAPRITIKSPKARTYAPGKRLRIRIACRDESGPVTWKATLRRKGHRARTVRAGERVRLARRGRYVLRVKASDAHGNATVKVVRFRVGGAR